MQSGTPARRHTTRGAGRRRGPPGQTLPSARNRRSGCAGARLAARTGTAARMGVRVRVAQACLHAGVLARVDAREGEYMHSSAKGQTCANAGSMMRSVSPAAARTNQTLRMVEHGYRCGEKRCNQVAAGRAAGPRIGVLNGIISTLWLRDGRPWEDPQASQSRFGSY